MKTLLFSLLLYAGGVDNTASHSTALDRAVVDAVIYALPEDVLQPENMKTPVTVTGHINERGRVCITGIESPNTEVEEKIRQSLGEISIVGGRFFRGKEFRVSILV